LIGDEVNAEGAELVECGDECFGGSGEAIIAPDKYDVDLAFAYSIEELLILRPPFIPVAQSMYSAVMVKPRALAYVRS